MVSDAGIIDKAGKILEIKSSTLCYSEKDLMWKDTKSFGTIELVPGWRPGKKTIQEARVRVATLKSQNYLVDLEALIVRLKQLKRLTQNSAFMPAIKEKVLENYFDRNFDTWRNLISPFHKYKDYRIEIDDKSLESEINEKRREIRMMSNELREVFHPSGKSKNYDSPKRPLKHGYPIGIGAALGASLALTMAASTSLKAAVKSELNKKEK